MVEIDELCLDECTDELVVGATSEPSEDEEPGTVLEQDPLAEELVPEGSRVDLVVAVGELLDAYATFPAVRQSHSRGDRHDPDVTAGGAMFGHRR